jgi:hypothetical protein
MLEALVSVSCYQIRRNGGATMLCSCVTSLDCNYNLYLFILNGKIQAIPFNNQKCSNDGLLLHAISLAPETEIRYALK